MARDGGPHPDSSESTPFQFALFCPRGFGMMKDNAEIGQFAKALIGAPKVGCSGFTLLELLLSMTITAIIIVLIFGVFRVGIRAWERGERDIEHQQRIRIVLEMMTHQLASLSYAKTLLKAGNWIPFEGGERRISFFSKVSLNTQTHHAGDVLVQYSIETHTEKMDLYATEKPVSKSTEIFDVDAVENAGRYRLLRNMHAIRFEYLKQMSLQGEGEWLSQWDPLIEGVGPMAVRIQLVDQPQEPPISVVIPVRNREALTGG